MTAPPRSRNGGSMPVLQVPQAPPEPRIPRQAPLSGTPAAPIVVRAKSAVNPILRAALYLFVLSIPFEIPTRTSLPVEIPTLTGAIFLFFTILQPGLAYKKIPGALVWFFVYLWVFGLSTLVNRGEHTQLIITQFLSHLELLLILWAGVNLLRDPKVLRGVFLALALAVTIRAAMQIFGIAATAVPLWTGGYRITVLGQNPNLSAIILSAGLITVLNLRPRILSWPVAAMIGYAIIQTGSRGGLLCAAGGMLVLLWQGRTPWVRVRSVLIGLVGVAALVFGALQTPMLRNRMEAAATEGSLAGRERIYPAALDMISERPWLGWGPTENQYEIGKRIGEEKKDRRDAHNIFLELMSATGFIGTIPFLIGLGLCFTAAWRARKDRYQMLPMALLMTVFIGCLSGTWIAAKVLWLAMAVALASGAVVKDAERKSCAV